MAGLACKIGSQHLQLYDRYKRIQSTTYTAEHILRTISLHDHRLKFHLLGFLNPAMSKDQILVTW